MNKSTSAWALMIGLVTAGGAAVLFSEGNEPPPTPDAASLPSPAATPQEVFPASAGELPPGHPPISDLPHGALPPDTGAPSTDVVVPRAKGGVTVVEIHEKATELEGATVTLAGRVTKVTPAVLGKTWLHIQDGTGDAAAKTNDIVVTTQAVPTVGEVVMLRGRLVRNRDLGSGYRYDVLVEDAELTKPL